MTHSTEEPAVPRTVPWRALGWSAAACLLLLPLVAMQFTDEVAWRGGDFLFAALLIGGTGLALELAVRGSHDALSKLGFALVLAGAFLMVWINAAVGLIGASSNDVNVLYGLVLLVGFAIGALGRFRPPAMFRAALATAAAQVVLTLAALALGLGQPEMSVLALVAVNALFMPFWLGAALFFHLAGRSPRADR
ncbi:MAG: hypothetical protein GVY11_01750 [Gammaproteobacteria bacterium]|jgi:hypothetical protein|nr:hypothetical protein [Gammaproteobacteria bacterium]